jgi:hypothetical protein
MWFFVPTAVCTLHPHGSRSPPTGSHSSGVRIGLADAPIGGHLEVFLELPQDLQLLAHLGELALEVLYLDLGNLFRLPICPIELVQVLGRVLLELLHPLLDLVPRKVLVPIVHRLELAAVNGNDRFGKQFQAAAQGHGLRVDLADGRAAIPRKSAMALKSGVWRPVSQTNSTLRCASSSSRRLDWMRFR